MSILSNILAIGNIGVDVKIYTYASAKLTITDVANFNAQYPTLAVKKRRCSMIGSSFLMAHRISYRCVHQATQEKVLWDFIDDRFGTGDRIAEPPKTV